MRSGDKALAALLVGSVAVLGAVVIWPRHQNDWHPPTGDIVAYADNGGFVYFRSLTVSKHPHECNIVVMARNTSDPPLQFRSVNQEMENGKSAGYYGIWEGSFIGRQFTVLPGVNEIDVWDMGRPGGIIDKDHLTPDVRLPVKPGEIAAIPPADPVQAKDCHPSIPHGVEQ